MIRNRPAGGQRSRAGLQGLYPRLAPWVEAVLWNRLGSQDMPLTPLSYDDVSVIAANKLAPLAVDLIRRTRPSVPQDLERTLVQNAFSWSATSLGVMAHGSEAAAELQDVGIRVAVSKGPGIAGAYPFWASRPFSDIDLLVPPADFARARQLLKRLGWRERSETVQPWRFFDPLCREAVNLRRGAGESIDIHHRIPPWIWSKHLSVELLLDETSDVTFFDQYTFPCLRTEANLLVAALHVVSDKNAPGQSLLVWRDVGELGRKADVAVTVALAERAHLAGWLKAVLLALPVFAQPHELIDALPAQGISHSSRLRLLLSSPGTRRRQGPLVSQCLRLPLANGALYVAGMAVPSPSFLALKSGRRWGYLQWWLGTNR